MAQSGPSIIDVSEIRAGMQGHGLTVFRGTTPERFDVEVIDVLHNFRPDQDLILVRTPHPLLDHAKAVGGMSGSPVYIDGRLAGAYAYGWQFGLDPVIGVTPIRSMLREMDRPTRPSFFAGAASPLPPRGRTRARRRASRGGIPSYLGGETGGALGPLRRLAQNSAPMPTGIERVATPLMLGGFDESIASMLGAELAPLGLTALQGGGGQGTPNASPRFVDGGAIGVQLIRGDVSATAIGTVTHVGAGHRLVAFGHPMMNGGEVGLPTATARVLHVLASAARSFKIAEALTPYGTLVHDRQSSIVVDTNATPETVPVRLRLRGLVDAPRTEWNMHVASHRTMTPVLVFGAMMNAIKAASSDEADVMYTARYTANIAGHDPVTLEDRGYMGAGPADARALSRLRLFDIMEVAYGNPFVPSRLESLDVELELHFGDDVLAIVDVSTPTNIVDPGSTVPVRVRTRRYGEDTDTYRTVQVRVPARAAGQTVAVNFAAGSSVRRQQAEARNLTDLVERAIERYPATSLVASVRLRSQGLRFPGHVADSLPRSVVDSLQFTTGQSPGRAFATQMHQPFDMGAVVAGRATLSLQVRQVSEEHRR